MMAVYNTSGRCHLIYDNWTSLIMDLVLFYDTRLVYSIERSKKRIIRKIKALSNDKFCLT